MSGQSIAVVGLACRFPDADDPAALLEVILAGRRTFRRLPRCRVDLADYYSAEFDTPDATYSTRAALIEGWQFDNAAFRIPAPVYLSTDPAHWLALETASRALASAGFPGGTGLIRDRVGVIIGNSLGGDTSRAAALRLHWPFVRRVLADALSAGHIPAERAGQVLRDASARYLAPFPAVGDHTLAGGLPSAIAAQICGYFGFRGGAQAVDGAGASSLLAVTAACTALTAGDVDVALAGGVDLGLDPLELVGLAKTGALATDQVRVYDQNPTGYLPGEGCGVVMLMRAADARSAGLPAYAQIAGWGTATAGQGWANSTAEHDVAAAADAHLLALRRAYERAAIDPADVDLIEGHGSGTSTEDAAELTALARLRAGAQVPAALGSIKANIGHARAAAGSAALIKTVLALGTGVIPPATGVSAPHSLLRDGGGALWLPGSAQEWPEGTRIAGVSAMDPVGINAHLVLRKEPDSGSRVRRGARSRPRVPRAASGPVAGQADRRGAGPAAATQRTAADVTLSAAAREAAGRQAAAYLLHAPDPEGLAAALSRLAQVAPWISDGEMQDLACELARAAATQGPARVAIVASSQEELARLATQALTMLPGLIPGLLTVRPGIFAADGADGRITLLLSDEESLPGGRDPDAILSSLAALRWLDSFGVRATAAVGDRLGNIAGLVWAGCISEADAIALAAVRAEILAGAQGASAAQGSSAAQGASAAARLRAAVDGLELSAPARRLISTRTGRELASAADIADLLSADLLGAERGADVPAGQTLRAATVRAETLRAETLRAGEVGASLLLATGPDQTLLAAATRLCRAPAVGLAAGTAAGLAAEPAAGSGDKRDDVHAAAALFAAGALGQPGQLAAGRPVRPIDIWREQIFITSPWEARPAGTPGTGPGDTAAGDTAVGTDGPGRPGLVPMPRQGLAVEPTGTGEPTGPVAGVAPWVRCFAEELRAPRHPVRPGEHGAWRVHVAGEIPFGVNVPDLFQDDPEADRVLAIIGNPVQEESWAAALSAARAAISTGRLVVITHDPGLSGFWAGLHAEHPSLGITVLRVPADADGLRTACRLATVVPGEFRELVIDPAGLAHEPVMVPVDIPGGGAVSLGQGDVVLLSRDAGPAGLAFAQVLACCGTPMAVLGKARPDQDSELVAGLEQLRAAGARIVYEAIDSSDAAQLDAAVVRVERLLGPVTAVAHAGPVIARMPVTEVTQTDLRARLAAQTAALGQLVGSVKTGQLRLIATFGSLAGRYGLAGESVLAMASGSLAEQARRLADGITGCRALHVDWPSWSGFRADEGSRLMLKMLATPGLPARLAVHGRMGPVLPETSGAAAPPAAGPPAPNFQPPGADRFRQVTRLYYPGVELICEAQLSLRSDPYLADYLLDGAMVLPPALALEAMAQVASALAGRLLRHATAVSMDAPVVIPAGADAQCLIRICALRDNATVQVVLRSAESGFGIEHYRAVFGWGDDAPDEPGSAAAAGASAAGASAAGAAPAGAAGPAEVALLAEPPAGGGLVDGSELYGPICFPTGRFRRIAVLQEVTSGSCRALARGGDDWPWFGAASDSDAELVLGSPGLADATLHMLQACVPHRRLLPAGCEEVTFSGRAAQGTVQIRAVAADRGGPGDIAGPGDLAGPGELGSPAVRASDQAWDIEAVDATGEPLISWRGVRMHDAGPLPRSTAWPPALLSVYLERVCAELGLGHDLRVEISSGEQDGAGGQLFDDQVGAARPHTTARQGEPGPAGTAPGKGQLTGLTLRVSADDAALACAWSTAEPGSAAEPEAGHPQAAARAQMFSRFLGEPPGTVRARLQAIAECLAMFGAPASCPITVREIADDSWVLLSAAEASMACTIVQISGVSGPVAIALMTQLPRPEQRHSGRIVLVGERPSRPAGVRA